MSALIPATGFGPSGLAGARDCRMTVDIYDLPNACGCAWWYRDSPVRNSCVLQHGNNPEQSREFPMEQWFDIPNCSRGHRLDIEDWILSVQERCMGVPA